MVILHLITHYHPHIYGAENFVKHLAQAQANTHEVHVVTGRWQYQWPVYEKYHGVHIHRVRVVKIRFIQTILAILPFFWFALKLQRKYKYNVIHSHIFPSLVVGALLRVITNSRRIPSVILDRQHSVPDRGSRTTQQRQWHPARSEGSSPTFITTIQGGDIGDYPEVFGPAFTANFFKKIIAWSLKQADTVHCVSTYLANEVIKLGVDKEKVVVIPNGVDTKTFKPQPIVLDRQRSEPDRGSALKFVTTSRLEAKNNLVQLIKVVAKLINNGHTLTLDIYGTGSQEQLLKEIIVSLKMEEQIKLKGYIDNKLLPKILPAYHFFIRLSKQEGFGISFLEAMACQVIPIGTPVGGITDIIKDKQNGYLINCPEHASSHNRTPYSPEPTSCHPERSEGSLQTTSYITSQLQSILTDSKNWPQIASHARKTCQDKFEWEKIISQVTTLYEK